MRREMIFRSVMTLIACCAADWSLAAEAPYHLGVAKVEITPNYPIRLNGFGFRREQSQGISQRIWAKALAISAGDEPPFVLLAIDSLGVRMSMVDEVARRLHHRFGVPRERVALTFSHSHCTPKVKGASDNIFSQPIPAAHQEHIDQYTRELADWLEQAAAAAINNRQPAQLAWTVGQVGFAKNRRTPGGPVDHDLPLLVVRDPAGKPRAIYVSYACHCVTLSFNQVSGDWAGYAQELIERRFPGAISLVSIGCGSDSNPTSGVTGDKTEVAMAQGAEIAKEVARLIDSDLKPISGPLTARLNLIDLALNDPPTQDQLLALAQKEGPAGYNAQTQLARLDRAQTLLTSIRYPLQSLTFGDSLQIVFLAGEVCVDYSLRLKRELRGDRLWLNGYSNDFCAYIPSERLVKEGGYGGGGEAPYFALPATFQPGLEQKIVDEVKRQTPASFHADPGTQGIPAKSPQQSRECLKTHDGLRIELVAAEPLVADPVAIDFGADGRLWVAEMADYARGVNDEFEPRGRVTFLTDADSDRQFDQCTEFLSGLRFPTDIKVWRNGVLVCDAPDILFAEDTDGDGRADVRRKLFSGFATHNPHARVNSLRYGLDNWVYGSGGLFGGKITSFNGQMVDVTNRDFRIHPDTGVIEPVTGHTQQGRPRDDWDNWFGCTNATLLTHYVVDDRYARRNPHVAPPPASRFVPDYPESQRLYPRGDLVLFKLSGAPGLPTSACGLEIYRDELLGEEYYGNSFTCEPVNQLVHRLSVSRNGASFSGRRTASEIDTEFLTSTDRWFRPVQVRTGLDGALWIVDMYRYVIEHPQWIPPETIAELDVLAGRGLGRIYRVVPKAHGARPITRLEALDNIRMAGALDSPNGPQRDLAQQLLIWRAARDVAPELEKIAHESRHAAARVQALATLDGLHLLRPESAISLLTDEHSELRRHGVRLCEQFVNDSPQVLLQLLRLVNDPAVAVRVQLACSLGECRDERAAKALATLANQSGDDPYIAGAVLSSMRTDNVVPILRAFATQSSDKEPGKLTNSLLTAAVAIGDQQILTAVLEQVTRGVFETATAWRYSTLAHVLDAVDRRRFKTGNSLAEPIRRAVRELFTSAQKTAASGMAPAGDRTAAVELLGRIGSPTAQTFLGDADDTSVNLLVSLTSATQPPAVQSAAIHSISRMASANGPQLLLSAWESATPRLRGEILDALLSRDTGAELLLGAIEKGQIKGHELDATRRERLLARGNADLRRRAEALLVSPQHSDRKHVLAQWQPVAAMQGDKGRGQDVFRKSCSPCHHLDGFGTNVGPDIAALTNKSPASLLVAILDPNRDMDGRYTNYIAQLADGRTVAGLLVSESGNSVTLREQGGKDHVLLRQDLDELHATGKSVMPEGLEKDLTQQDLADTIAYLLQVRLPPNRFPGNQAELIVPDKHGTLVLSATTAEIYGTDIAFESASPFRNIGYWHGANDYAGWQIQLPEPGRFDVYFDYACAEESAGNGFRFEGGEPTLRGVVASTVTWANYRLLRVGTVEFAAGRSYLTLRYDGEKQRPALLDLRAVHLVPCGATPPFAALAPGSPDQPSDPAGIAQSLLDEKQPKELREKLIADHPQHAAAMITALTADLPPDAKEEYRRIPWIWRVAIAAGKRNDTAELRSVLQVALPAGNQPLRDWRAVVIGGGIINGVSQAKQWPKPRIEAVLKVDGVLVAKWQRAVELAAAMADDDQVPAGTRYDALRMVAMGSWDLRGRQLQRYLAPGVNDELQMGAVSGLSDMQSPRAAESLLRNLNHLSARNRELALDGLVRSPDCCQLLLEAISGGKLPAQMLPDKHRSQLLEHSDPAVRNRAREVLQK